MDKMSKIISTLVLASCLSLAAGVKIVQKTVDDSSMSSDFRTINTWLTKSIPNGNPELNIAAGKKYMATAALLSPEMREAWTSFLKLSENDECNYDRVKVLLANHKQLGVDGEREVLMKPQTRVGQIVLHYTSLHAKKCAKYYKKLYDEVVRPVRHEIKFLGDMANEMARAYLGGGKIRLSFLDILEFLYFMRGSKTNIIARIILEEIEDNGINYNIREVTDPHDPVQKQNYYRAAMSVGDKCVAFMKATKAVTEDHLDKDPFAGRELNYERKGPLEGLVIAKFCQPLVSKKVDIVVRAMMRYNTKF